MHIIDHIITKKYALAYINANPTSSHELVQPLQTLITFIKKHPVCIAALNQPMLSINKRDAIIQALLSFAHAPDALGTLILLLIKHKRLSLLALVLQEIVNEYYQQSNILPVRIESSHELNDTEKEIVLGFIKKKTNTHMLKPDFIVNSSLISGLRILSPTHLWEQSINNVLKNVKLSMLQRVEL